MKKKRKKWFCSEFVSYLLKSGGLPGIDTVMKSQNDIYQSNLYVKSVDYTISSFSEENLINVTSIAKKKFIDYEKRKRILQETHGNSTNNDFYERVIATESLIPRLLKRSEYELIQYTPLIDWKELHEKFIEYFGENNLSKKFSMIGLIIRSSIDHLPNTQVTNYVINEFNKISKIIHKRDRICMININEKEIKFIQNNIIKTVYYPKNFNQNKLSLEAFIILN